MFARLTKSDKDNKKTAAADTSKDEVGGGVSDKEKQK